MVDTTYGPKVYMTDGGDKQVIASGGEQVVESGGTVTIETGAIYTNATTQTLTGPAPIVLSGSAITTGINFTGTAERAIDFGSMTVGTTTDGVLMRAGTGIGASGLEFGTAGQRAIALYLRPTAILGTFKGMRLRSIADPASGSSLSMDNFHSQASIIAGKDAAVVNSGFFELIPKGTNTITYGRGMLIGCDSAAAVTYTDLTLAHVRAHTRGDETMNGVDEMFRIENEAVGGSGRQMDSFIRCMETSMSGGIKSAAYLIDAGTGTNLLATAIMRLPDDGSVCEASGAGDGTSILASHFIGYGTIVVGSTTMYVPLLTSKPADIS